MFLSPNKEIGEVFAGMDCGDEIDRGNADKGACDRSKKHDNRWTLDATICSTREELIQFFLNQKPVRIPMH